jgi:hypothetical protein
LPHQANRQIPCAEILGGVDGLGRVWGEWIPKFVDL